ncbi:dihydrofolate reductase [Aplysia californica]|uniref:dihydrofolate reductase n=1 Tax=Aplysia californica TaxID=6500 RepID=A0ABM0K609_APLCA|nr:dihydrofolate reductase [Aplysia californica]XP_035828547.1 dihydrofolate reductase [Aplysia californica]
MTSTKLNIVVAVCTNMGIGIEGRLPWRLKQDMAFFKQLTVETQDEQKKNMVIMGKKTWMSIPTKFRPLQDRVNVVLSTQLTEPPSGALLASSLKEAVNLAKSDANVENVFVIGGASVYREAVEGDCPCRIYLTRVDKEFECDTFFPKFDTDVFKRIQNPNNVPTGINVEGDLSFTFEVYEKNLFPH